MTTIPCPWPGCRERSRFRSMQCEIAEGGKRLTYYRCKCPKGHTKVDWSQNRPNHVLANARGHRIHV